MWQVCCSALPPPLEKARCSSYSYSDSSSSSSSTKSSSSRSSSSSSSEQLWQQQQRRQQQHLPSCCAPRAAAAAPQPQPQPRSPAAPQTRKPPLASRSRRRHEARPGPRLLDAALRCVARLLLASLKSVQDQVSKTPVVVEGKVQGLAPAGGSSSNSTREPPASDRVAPVKVLDKWPLRGGAGGLQRDQVISVGSCVPLERNQRYIFFLEPTEQPLVFKTAFAPVDPNGKNIKKEVGKILCTDCDNFMASQSDLCEFEDSLDYVRNHPSHGVSFCSPPCKGRFSERLSLHLFSMYVTCFEGSSYR
ncbi:hypothetical protein STEG23_031657 [Scotinomys teguina]